MDEFALAIWPKMYRQKRLSAVQLGLYLRRMQSNLEQQGIGVEICRSNGHRHIELKQLTSNFLSTRH